MNSSFSLSRFGVKRPLSNARCGVCLGGSNDTRCSLIGNWSRWASMRSEMSSPITLNGNGNGPNDELCRHGYGKLNLSDVATQAGISRPTFYKFFSSKDELLSAFSQVELQ